MVILCKPRFIRFISVLMTIVVLTVPIGGWAQSLEPEFETMTVSLWAEFDRPEVLVIYRGQLGSDGGGNTESHRTQTA